MGATSLTQADLSAVFDAAWARCSRDAGTDGVLVGLCRLDAWSAWLPEAAALLDEAERQRAGRMKRAPDADARVLAYALHRLFLAAAMGIDPRTVPLSRDPQGCPVVGHGDWRTSLSHAEGAIAIAIAVGTAGPVGIDIEHAHRAADTDGIADEIWHPSECAAWSDASRAHRSRALLQTWVRKEAYLKASGTGLLEPMSRFVLPEDVPMRLPAHPVHGARDDIVVTVLLPGLADHVVALSHVPGRPVHAMVIEPV